MKWLLPACVLAVQWVGCGMYTSPEDALKNSLNGTWLQHDTVELDEQNQIAVTTLALNPNGTGHLNEELFIECANLNFEPVHTVVKSPFTWQLLPGTTANRLVIHYAQTKVVWYDDVITKQFIEEE